MDEKEGRGGVGSEESRESRDSITLTVEVIGESCPFQICAVTVGKDLNPTHINGITGVVNL